ncbi:MAG: SDR family NAD(P)-dependent oxidoreductase [Byssovorax sp.]
MTSPTAENLQAWLITHVATLRDVDPRSVDPRERFSDHGLDSLGAIRLVTALAQHLGRSLSPTLLWDHSTIEALAAHLSGATAPAVRADAEATPRDADEPIAVVGMSCRFPGARDPAAFWQLLAGGQSAIGEVPRARGWDELLHTRGVASAERTKVCRGGFLDEIAGFDPLFFGISPREAISMDPQQRLILELCWEAIEDAGIRPSSLKGSRTGVFAGAIWSDYAILMHRGGMEALGQYTVTGYHHSIIANRVSYLFGLEGPSLTLDSACSSGLVVSHLACESLRRGESTLALVGAVNLNVLPESALATSRFGALSNDGRCFSFDARANGYVRGEGGGVLVLKTLSRAVADGDPIHCVIRGSAVNNDGASNGMTAPSRKAQEAVLRTAYRSAGVELSQVQYVEAHGTGTPLGDPIEATALGAVIGAGRSSSAPLLIGSAKTNVGHLEGAAGMVGLTKVALAIKHRQVPASLNFESPNPLAPLHELGLAVPTSLRAWPAPEQSLIAGVSSFGLGGTNGHVVVSEWPAARAELLALAADTPEVLRSRVETLREALASNPATTSLHAICADAAPRVDAPTQRLAVVARSSAELDRSLARDLAGEPGATLHATRPSPVDTSRGVVFVFPGQGSQWFGMARSLLQSEPIFRATIEQCDRLARPYLGWSLIDELTTSRARSRLDRIDVSLPAIISIDIAVSALWRERGIEPAAVVGHSTGEIAAAYVAGALSLDDTMRIICAYGHQIVRNADRGSMALVGLSWEQAGEALIGYEGRVHRAIQDSPVATVVAGEPAAVATLLAELQARGVFCPRVNMNVAPHCPLADYLRDDLLASLQGIQPRRGSVPLISEVTGDEIDGSALDAAHWVRNFGDQAFFSSAVGALIKRGHRVFLDVGPHPISKHSVEANLRHEGAQGVVLSSMRRDEDERGTHLDTLGALHALGLPVRWDALYPSGDARATDGGPWLLPLSAKSPAALADVARAYAALLRSGADAPRLRDVAFTASTRRDHHAHRLAVVGSTREEIALALAAFASGEAPAEVTHERASLGGIPRVFVFSGQGSQWVGMGRQLLDEEPVFRATIEAIDALLRGHVAWSLLDELRAPDERSRLGETEIVQPALFALQVGLAALLRSWGVTPDAVVGHSVGEVAAAHVAGALSLEEAVRLVAWRGRIMQRATGLGKMAWVALPQNAATKAIAGHESVLAIAAVNDPSSVVLSGDATALEEVLSALGKRGVEHRALKVNYAFHSPQMEALARELVEALGQVEARPTTIPLYSTVSGAALAGEALDAAYWGKNVRDCVQLARAVESALVDGHRLFLEVGPHPVLATNLAQCVASRADEAHVVFTLRRQSDERIAMLRALGSLHVRGVEVAFGALYPAGGRCVALPTYAWQRELYWTDAAARAAESPRAARGGHPLLGSGFGPADRPEAHYWEQRLSLAEIPYLADHLVRGEVVFPGAAYLEMALAAGTEAHGAGKFVLEDLVFERMLVLTEGAARRTQVALLDHHEGQRASLGISSRDEAGKEWVRHATALVSDAAVEPESAWEIPQLVQARCPILVEGAAHYARMEARQIHYGPAFRGVERIWVGAGEALGQVRLPESAAGAAEYRVHPALLDACLQVTMALFSGDDDTFVPSRIGRLRLHERPPSEVWVKATLSQPGAGANGAIAVDLVVVDDAGRPLLTVGEMHLHRLARAAAPDPFAGCAYTVAWRRKDLPSEATSKTPTSPGAWLLFADAGGLGAAIAGQLRERGQICVVVAPGERFTPTGEWQYTVDPSKIEDYQRLFREALPADMVCRGVVHLWSLDAAPWERTTSESLLADVRRGALSAVRLIQAIARQGFRDPPRLVVVTRGAQAMAEPASGPIAAAQTPLWGLARTIAMEQPDLGCTRVDLAPERRADEARSLVGELLSSDGEDQIALRDGGRFAARLTQSSLDPEDAEGGPRSHGIVAEGSYLIVGGVGGLGLTLSRWMVAEGARHLALVGRSAPSAAAHEAIRAMEQAGAEVRVLRGDVAVAADVERIMGQIRDELPPLRGVVHAAAALDDRTLVDLEESQFWTPIRPKILGAWNLHVATRALPLDFFVMYSSVAALMGSPGQGAYAAGNAFLDALAHARAAAGLPGMSLQWGPFAEVGLAAAHANRGQRLAQQGFQSFTPDDGTALFSRLLQRPRAEVGLLRISWRQWLESNPQATGMRFLAELEGEKGAGAGAKVGSFRPTLDQARPADRAALIQAHVLEQLGRVLSLDPSRIDRRAPFTSLGVDSLTSMELRNRLEASLGLQLSATFLFTHPIPAALALHFLDVLYPAPASLPEAPPLAAPPPSAEDIDHLGADALLALLDEELALERKNEKVT